jgi:hypothetical protein
MRICEICSAEFQPRQKNRSNRFCSFSCYNASGRPIRRAATVGPRMVRRPDHPLAPPSGTVSVCRIVLFENIGPGTHPCHWCDAPVTWLPGAGVGEGALVADHLDWDQQNNDPANLVPSCNICNAHRTREGDRRRIDPDELFVVRPNGSRHRAVARDCEWCGVRFAAMLAQIRQSKGRFCSMSCARKANRATRRADSA